MKYLLIAIMFIFYGFSGAVAGERDNWVTLEMNSDWDSNRHQTVTKNYGCYVIEFYYNKAYANIPATMPLGKPHYDATITVYEIVEGKKEKVGESFRGVYTTTGCCMSLEQNVKRAIENAKELVSKED